MSLLSDSHQEEVVGVTSSWKKNHATAISASHCCAALKKHKWDADSVSVILAVEVHFVVPRSRLDLDDIVSLESNADVVAFWTLNMFFFFSFISIAYLTRVQFVSHAESFVVDQLVAS